MFLIANLALAPYAAKARVTQDMHRHGCTGQPNFDFLAMMIPHHEGAVDMARLVLIHWARPDGAANCGSDHCRPDGGDRCDVWADGGIGLHPPDASIQPSELAAQLDPAFGVVDD